MKSATVDDRNSGTRGLLLRVLCLTLSISVPLKGNWKGGNVEL
jgi:hypothetical protein